jgi:hypothetical protein
MFLNCHFTKHPAKKQVQKLPPTIFHELVLMKFGKDTKLIVGKERQVIFYQRKKGERP